MFGRCLRILITTALALAGLSVVAGPASADSAGTVTQFPIGTLLTPSSALIADSTGNLWFTDGGNLRIGRLSTTGAVTYFSTGDYFPTGITYGPGGNLWFTELTTNPVGSGAMAYLNPGTGNITQVGSTAPISYPQFIVTGSDGNVWFNTTLGKAIGRMTPTGVMTSFSAGLSQRATNLVTGPDGNVWFTEASGLKIGNISPTGVITENSNGITSVMSGIATGSDGNIWFAATPTNVGRISTAPGATATIFPNVVPAGSQTYGITSGPDGNLWFTDYRNSVWSLTTDGVANGYASNTDAPVPPGGRPTLITGGPDGNMWFTQTYFDEQAPQPWPPMPIGRVTTGAPLPVIVRQTPTKTTTSVTVRGTVFPGGMSQVQTLECATNSSFTKGLVRSTSVAGSPATGIVAATVSGTCSGLRPNTVYFTRFLGANSAPGTVGVSTLSYTTARSFTTAALPPGPQPVVTIRQAAPVKHRHVKLAGTTRAKHPMVFIYRAKHRHAGAVLVARTKSSSGRWHQPAVSMGGHAAVYFCARVGSSWSNTIRVPAAGKSRAGISEVNVRGDIRRCP